MVWLGLRLDSISMTVTVPPEKLEEVTVLVGNWLPKYTANIHELHTILGKLFYMAQCCSPARLFLN